MLKPLHAVLVGLISAGTLVAPVHADERNDAVRVEGTKWLRGGQPFFPHGFNMVALATPQKCIDEGRAPGWAKRAHDTFAQHGDAELAAAKGNWSADTLRFQVSQVALDPQHPYYADGSYLTWVKAGVAKARAAGFTVLLSMQDQVATCGEVNFMPSQRTIRSWKTLAPHFTSDHGVLFELFNEPRNDTSEAGWKQWRDGDGAAVVGHQRLVDTVRGLGARNVLVANGAALAERFEGMWPHRLNDPVGQLAYATHPYYWHFAANNTLERNRARWQERFGYVVDRGAPVIVTEWNARHDACRAGMPGMVEPFLDYLRERGIPLLTHAFDVQDTMVKGLHPNWEPTTLDGSRCVDNEPVRGPDAGSNVRDRFRTW
ncbi:glycoside hydrolase family 5 protein [Allokutzneria albata]|uniref:cellulase n=1 Tax=Allokutzneria albata TaxID=211114 RepID=A0A1G9T703_ALLAB|nr:cellulase family glycosylhydrolase [Allokutzneria albata]SDM43426.1 Cellulase (glycosyl hydrolase family 5) [Allokutzneria albata]